MSGLRPLTMVTPQAPKAPAAPCVTDAPDGSTTTDAQIAAEANLGMDRYADGFVNLPREPHQLHGLVYESFLDGHTVNLKTATQTSEDIPAGGPDIPRDAVKDNRVVIFVDGIHQDIDTQKDQIHRLFQAPRNDPKHGAACEQPVIGIHEAAGINAGADGTRIAIDLAWLKALQGRYLPTAWVHKACFQSDAAVRSVHNEIKQSLEAGRDVQIALHSGGGAETALALTLLSKENGGQWKPEISKHVRVLAMAPACSRKDFELAGVKPDNIYYTASRNDPVYRFSKDFVPPTNQGLLALRAARVGVQLLFDRSTIPYHAPDYIFWRNLQPDGTQRIQAYLDGGPGGDYELP